MIKFGNKLPARIFCITLFMISFTLPTLKDSSSDGTIRIIVETESTGD